MRTVFRKKISRHMHTGRLLGCKTVHFVSDAAPTLISLNSWSVAVSR